MRLHSAAPRARLLLSLLTLLTLLAALVWRPAAAADGVSSGEPLAPGIEEMYRQALLSIIEGRKNDASATLQQLIVLEPLHAGAWLDLALIQCGLGHAAEAERMFGIIEQRFAPTPSIQRLINEERQRGCERWEPRSTLDFSAGRGYDQNVNQGSRNPNYVIGTPDNNIELPLLPEFLQRADHYTLLSADYTRDLSANGTLGYAQVQLHRNDQLHDYDSNSLFVGVDTPWRWRGLALRSSATLGWITLGSQLYQRQAQLQGQVGLPLDLPLGMQASLSGTLARADYLRLSNFNATSIDWRLRLSHQAGSHSASLSVGLQRDYANVLRPGGDRRGNSVQAQWRQRYGNAVMAELSYSLQNWNSERAYSPGLIDQVRDQRTHVLRGTLSYPLGRDHNLLLELRDLRNQENISLFQYSSRQIQLSWQWQGL